VWAQLDGIRAKRVRGLINDSRARKLFARPSVEATLGILV